MAENAATEQALRVLREGTVIPAHPLALDRHGRLDVRRQRALTRYYVAAGARGIAVGVHTTQFAIRRPEVGLFEPVLALASETVDRCIGPRQSPVVKIAGVCGKTPQAVAEAELALRLGYHACLLSLAALHDATVSELVAHCREIAQSMPVIGFYLQPDVGGRVLPLEFWRRFAEIENVVAVKIAPFNRYRTLDVIRAVCDAGRAASLTLYTGNDDSIVTDLLTRFRFRGVGAPRTLCIRGGLLGHWAVWTRRAVEMHARCRRLAESGDDVPADMLTLAAQVTDANAAFFDAANGFAGCIAGIHEVLRRAGLLETTRCLAPDEGLSPGQSEEIDRVLQAYPHLSDFDFVRQNADDWLAD
jgi:dihydrodipicolinate synthase/N-acetylneuraminate lyase